MRTGPVVAGRWLLTRALWRSVKVTSGRASATRANASAQCANSVASLLRNLRRAGVLK
jgi:hypothetical protein